MKYFRFEVPHPEVHLYPLVCWHIGAKQSSTKFIRHVLDQIKADPLARAIYMGDAGECVTKTSKGNIYEQLLSPGDQLRVAADLFGEIKDKLLFGVRGNHGNRIDRDSGLGWDEVLCARVGIPYMGVSCLGDITLDARKYSDFVLRRSSVYSFSLYVHHGSAGSITPGGKMNAGHKPGNLAVADVALTAHHHGCGENWPHRVLATTDSHSRRIRWIRMRLYSCGSAYDSRSGYAEEKMYPVIVPQHIVVTARVKRTMRDARDLLDLEVSHSIIDGSGDEFVNDDEMHKWVVPPAWGAA